MLDAVAPLLVEDIALAHCAFCASYFACCQSTPLQQGPKKRESEKRKKKKKKKRKGKREKKGIVPKEIIQNGSVSVPLPYP